MVKRNSRGRSCPRRYTLDGEPHTAGHISMIAGGTGITPMYQVGGQLDLNDDVAIFTFMRTL